MTTKITRVSKLMALAASCTSDEATLEVMTVLVEQFANSQHLSGLEQRNPEAYLEADGKPDVNLELVKVISGHYVISVKPEVRNGDFTVHVQLTRCLDGRGIDSQNFQRLEDHEDLILGIGTDTLDSIAKKAKILALALHSDLLKEAGVETAQADRIAKKAW